jgi:V8-like Glu-specific endopeptidase
MRTLLTAVVVVVAGCGGPGAEFDEGPTQGAADKAVVYGRDNRTDVYAHSDATMRARAQDSTVALMTAEDIEVSSAGAVKLKGTDLAASHNLCAGERFGTDPTAAFCTGTLIDDDVVLTAGHCIPSARECENTRFVFRYYRTSATELQTVTSADVFACSNIIVRQQRDTPQGPQDFALIRLTRKATPRFKPAPVRLERAPLVVGQAVGVIGSGSGVPFKIDTGGRVRQPGAGVSFVATTDTFGGNSGSGVYDEAGSVVGILVEGDTDYVRRGSCNAVNVCSARACRGETVVYVRQPLEAWCRVSPRMAICTEVPGSPTEPVSLPFTADNTNTATRATSNRTVELKAGQLLTAGTCGVPGATGSGDTYLRLTGPGSTSRTLVADNDDACGGELSLLRFTALVDGTYVIRAGCYGATACSGTVAYTVR